MDTKGHIMSNRIFNAKIQEIGIMYCGHTRQFEIRMTLDGRGWGCSLTISMKRLGAIMRALCDYADARFDSFDDGMYIHELKGLPVRVMMDQETTLSSHPIAIGAFFSEDDELEPLYDNEDGKSKNV